eukprot:2911847-Pyramimonas_sp.AAC.1
MAEAARRLLRTTEGRHRAAARRLLTAQVRRLEWGAAITKHASHERIGRLRGPTSLKATAHTAKRKAPGMFRRSELSVEDFRRCCACHRVLFADGSQPRV